MQLMSSEGRGLDRDTIDSIINHQISDPGSECSLKHLFKTTTVFFRLTFPQAIFLGRFFGEFYNNMESFECHYLSCFRSDSLFGTRVTHAANQHLQSLFRLCSKFNSPEDIDSRAFNFVVVYNDIVCYRFFCVLPLSLEKKKNPKQDKRNMV